MSRLRFNITMTLDGYVAGPNQSVEHPLGEGTDHLHDWLFRSRTFREMHGETGVGETGTNDDIVPSRISPLAKTESSWPLKPLDFSASTSHASTAPEKNVKPRPRSAEAAAQAQNGAEMRHIRR